MKFDSAGTYVQLNYIEVYIDCANIKVHRLFEHFLRLMQMNIVFMFKLNKLTEYPCRAFLS